MLTDLPLSWPLPANDDAQSWPVAATGAPVAASHALPSWPIPVPADVAADWCDELVLVNPELTDRLQAIVGRLARGVQAEAELAAMRRFLWMLAMCKGGRLVVSHAALEALNGIPGELAVEGDARGNVVVIADPGGGPHASR